MGTEAVAIDISASPHVVWALLADVPRMGEWSPECVKCRWLAPADRAVRCARFKGTSRKDWHRWSTTSTIVEAEPGSRLAFDVTYLRRPVARWQYDLRTTPDGGTTVAESMQDHRGRWLRLVSPYITGSRDRSTRNASTMHTTLERLKAAAEQ